MEGHIHSACSNWLRASNYYRTSEVFLKLDDRRRSAVLERMRACSDLVVKHRSPGGERVRIPCFEDSFVEAYFLRAPETEQPAPVVVCVGGQGHFKDGHLHILQRHAHARGLSLLLIDLPGQGASPKNKVSVRYEVETAISSCVDYLVARGDVDERRIAIFGDGLGAAFASRAANLDDRFAVSVSDAGIWDMHERVSRMTWMSGSDAKDAVGAEIRRMGRHGGLGKVRCPTLVAFGERDWLDIGHATEMCRVLREAGADVTLKVFSAAETGASHAQADNPTIGNEFIFDWIATRLDIARSAGRS